MTAMMTLSAALGGGVLLATAGWGLRRFRRHARPRRAGPALVRASQLVELIAQVQQHRGMCGAWLAGDASFAARLPEKQAAVSRLFSLILEGMPDEEAEDHPCFVSHDVRLLRHRWDELVSRLADCTPEQSFQTHCRIVGRLLDWLAATGEARIEQPFAGVVPAAAARNFAHRLPVLAECLGQARALGSAVAVKRYCPPVARVRLAFLASRSETLLGQAADTAAEGGGAVAAEARRAVRDYLEAIRGRLLATRDVDLPAGEYFALATRAMEAVFAWLEAEKHAVATALRMAARQGDTTGEGRP